MKVYVCTFDPECSNSTVVGVATTAEEAKALGDRYARKSLRWVHRLGDDSWTANTLDGPKLGSEAFEVWPFDLTGHDDV